MFDRFARHGPTVKARHNPMGVLPRSSGIRRVGRHLLIAVVALSTAIACGSRGIALPAQTRPSPPVRLHGPPPVHIAIVAMENKEYRDVLGSHDAPFVNGLARRSA